MNQNDLRNALAPGWFVDSDHPSIQAFAQRVTAGTTGQREAAIALFYAVRDEIRYNPYTLVPDKTKLKASSVLAAGEAFCVPKAVLLTAAGRAAGVPSRLGFADVRNHLASPRLLELMRTDVFAFHGYTEFYLDERWVKATPAFNRSLCEKFGSAPLEFNGVQDAVFQPFDLAGAQYMEYIKERGVFTDLPYDEMLSAYREVYPQWFDFEHPPQGDMETEGPGTSRKT